MCRNNVLSERLNASSPYNTVLNSSSTVAQDWTAFKANFAQWAFFSSIQNSPLTSRKICYNDYCIRNGDNAGAANDVDDCNYANASKRPRIQRERSEEDLINKLPDELLIEVFKCIPRARDRAACASVCMRWLMLESHMQMSDICWKQEPSNGIKCDNRFVVDEFYSDQMSTRSAKVVTDENQRAGRQSHLITGDLTRSLEGKKATDVRLAAIAVGTTSRGGLGKLSIRGQGSITGPNKGVTDMGISAIGFCCAALQSLTLWDCPNITDEGLCSIGKGCSLLQKVDLMKCPLVGNLGLQNIAKHCHQLLSLSVDDCALIGDPALACIANGCPELIIFNLKKCPLVSNTGLQAIAENCKKLKKMKLQHLKVSDEGIASVSTHCKSLTSLSLKRLDFVTERGFMLFCKSSGMHSLKDLCVIGSNSFSDNVLVMMGNMFNSLLKHISLTKCQRITDQGLTVFLCIASSLETLHVERCNLITEVSIITSLSSRTGKLKEIHFRNCDGSQVKKQQFVSAPILLKTNSIVNSISLANCGSIGDNCVSLLGLMCQHLTTLDLTGLTCITDKGLLALLKWGSCQLVSVNLSGCTKLTDRTVTAIAQKCGGSLKTLVLDGCNMVTDIGLLAIGKYCSGLEDLDISGCSVTDNGVRFVVSQLGPTLNSLNLSGCRGITDRVLPLIREQCQSLVGLNLRHCQGLTRRVINKFVADLWQCDILCA